MAAKAPGEEKVPRKERSSRKEGLVGLLTLRNRGVGRKVTSWDEASAPGVVKLATGREIARMSPTKEESNQQRTARTALLTTWFSMNVPLACQLPQFAVMESGLERFAENQLRSA